MFGSRLTAQYLAQVTVFSVQRRRTYRQPTASIEALRTASARPPLSSPGREFVHHLDAYSNTTDKYFGGAQLVLFIFL